MQRSLHKAKTLLKRVGSLDGSTHLGSLGMLGIRFWKTHTQMLDDMNRQRKHGVIQKHDLMVGDLRRFVNQNS